MCTERAGPRGRSIYRLRQGAETSAAHCGLLWKGCSRWVVSVPGGTRKLYRQKCADWAMRKNQLSQGAEEKLLGLGWGAVSRPWKEGR